MALRVLLADESSTIKKVFEIGLKDFGLEIRNVQHGIDVIEVAEDFQPDIIFADVLLSKMNGYEVCGQVKQHEDLKSVPVVLMWSSFMDIDNEKYSACKADGRLEKPFSAEQLRAKIQSLVTRTLDNKVANHLEFDDSLTTQGFNDPQQEQRQASEQKPRKRHKPPSEDLLYKEDLPLETQASPEALDYDSAEDESSFEPYGSDDFSFGDDYEDSTSETDSEVDSFEFSDEDLHGSAQDDEILKSESYKSEAAYDSEPYEPEPYEPQSYEEDSDYDRESEDDGLDGFQALDITGSSDSDESWNHDDNFSDFQISSSQDESHADDSVPLDFNPPSPDLDEDEKDEALVDSFTSSQTHTSDADAGDYDLGKETTAVPSIEEEAELLEKSKEDSSMRSLNLSEETLPEDLKTSTPSHNMSNTQHRSIDELSKAAPDKIKPDEIRSDNLYPGHNLPPVPEEAPKSQNSVSDSASSQDRLKNASQALSQLSKEELKGLIEKDAKEMLQAVIWEVVPELAKQMIDKEVKRLLAEEEKPESAT